MRLFSIKIQRKYAKTDETLVNSFHATMVNT